MSQDEWAIRSKWQSEDNAHEDEQYLRSLEENDKDARIADLTRQLATDAKAHEKEIVVWSENYAALERQLAEARTDAELAVALAYQRAANVADDFHKRALEWAKKVRGLEKHIEETDSSRIRDTILALAPAEPLAEVQALKAERDDLLHDLARLKESETHELNRAEAAEATVTRLQGTLEHMGAAVERMEAAEAKVARLREALAQLLIEYDEVDLAAAEPPSLTAAVLAARAALTPTGIDATDRDRPASERNMG